MKIDIVMPIHNRPILTEQSIVSLFENTVMDFELYAIDDASDIETKNILNDLKGKYGFELYTNIRSVGPAASRNYICNEISKLYGRNDFLYHSDNDVYFRKDWDSVLIKVFRLCNDEFKLLGAGCHKYLQSKNYFNYAGYIVGEKDAVSGYSQLMNWETWDKYGPFSDANKNEKIKIMGSEDWKFCQDIVKDGFKVGSLENELVIQTGRTNTYGNPATGSETIKDIEGIKII